MSHCSGFWNVLAQSHAGIEDTNFDLANVRRLLPEIASPVLVAGAGQGLIVEELCKHGHACDGLDLSSGMVRQARLRRGISLVQADARAMPFPAASYATVIFATGVVDFTAEDEAIRAMLTEARRVAKASGKVIAAFYKASADLETFLESVGLLQHHTLAHRQSMEIHLMNPVQLTGWIARRAGCGRLRATITLLRMAARSTAQERRATLKMQRLIAKLEDPSLLINAAPEKLPYRNEAEIDNLFRRLGIPIKQLSEFASCRIVRI